ncbi:hypothetical protein ES705_18227 [subsurface metagenome]
MGGKTRVLIKIVKKEREGWRKTAVTFSARAGGVVGCGVVAYTPADHFNPPPRLHLGGLGRNAGGGEAADFRDETGGCQLPFLPLVIVRLGVVGRLRG